MPSAHDRLEVLIAAGAMFARSLEPRTTLEEGLRRTYPWIEAQVMEDLASRSVPVLPERIKTRPLLNLPDTGRTRHL